MTDSERNSRERHNPPLHALPPSLEELARFLRTASILGREIAFWRSSGRLDELRMASSDLNSILLNPSFFQMREPSRTMVREALESVLESVTLLMEAVPFRTKVGGLRRGLVPCYQEIFILHHLLLSVLCRMRHQAADPEERIPKAGSLMDSETKREAHLSVQAAIPFWTKPEWNVYDYL